MIFTTASPVGTVVNVPQDVYSIPDRVYNIPDPVYNIPDPVYNIPDHVGPLNCFLRRGFVDNLYDSSQILSEES